jgi:hypothetical protein
VIPRFSFSPSKHIEHIVLFSFPLITVPIHLSIYKVLLLLVGRVRTIVKLVRVIDFTGGVTGATSRVVAVAVS